MTRPFAFATRSLLPILLLLPAAASANHVDTAPQTAAPTTAKPGLWVLKDEDTLIYLFGTIHFLKPGSHWQNPTITKAFASADTLMMEIPDSTDQAALAQKILPLAMTKDAPPLSNQLEEGDRAAYHAALAKYGMPATAFDSFKPWFAAITLSLMPAIKAGYDPKHGVETILTAQARMQNKALTALETPEQQLGYFDMLPVPLQIAYLNESVKLLDESAPMLDQMVALWQNGQVDELAAVLNESLEATPELHHLLLDKRNEDWAEKLEKQLEKPGTVFVAVGSGHLAGKGSVQDYLAKRGLTALRVIY